MKYIIQHFVKKVKEVKFLFKNSQPRLWLKKIRKERNITIHEIAMKTGITQQYYWYIENGMRNPSTKLAKLIGNLLNFDWTNFY